MINLHHKVNPLVRWGFYGFVLSIPFEYPDRTIPVEVHTITGAIFLMIAFLQPGICFRRPPAVFWLFLVYVFIWTILGLLMGVKYPSEFVTMFLIYVEGILLFWTAYNLMLNGEIAKNALLTFAISCALMAVLLRTGYFESGLGSVGKYSGSGRLTGMGQDPNILAGNLALGILTLIGLTYGVNKQIIKFRAFYLIPIPLMGICLAYTGSRGGVTALGVGLLVFTLKRGNMLSRVKSLTGILLLFLFFLWANYHAGGIWNRYLETLEDGNMAAREEIYPQAWKMFLEKPLAGWGPVNNKYKLAARTAEEGRESPFRDTHNLWLELLTATGVLGALPFLLGVWLCLQAAWKARASAYGIIPLVLMITVLILNISVNWIQSKQDWLVFAFALASSRALMGARLLRRAAPSNPRLRPAVLGTHGPTAEAFYSSSR
jgi:O-antigen ligase